LKNFKKWFIRLLLLDATVFGAGYLLGKLPGVVVSLNDLGLLTLFFTFISVVIMLIFFSGLNKDQGARTIHILVAVSLKLLLELVLAVLWFIIGKKTTFNSLYMFFILYLLFTVFTTLAMYKNLKTKSL
jgi:hypothetical protein